MAHSVALLWDALTRRCGGRQWTTGRVGGFESWAHGWTLTEGMAEGSVATTASTAKRAATGHWCALAGVYCILTASLAACMVEPRRPAVGERAWVVGCRRLALQGSLCIGRPINT